MKLIEKNITQELNESFLVETLNLNGKTILELGCGNAAKTIEIASNGFDRFIYACEVDKIQHEKNLKLEIKNIKFLLCGAEELPFENNSIDMVFMFKSLHHVPIELMDTALSEIKRVLKPNGLAYFSEPIFDGDLNEIIALFHDEKYVREKAFEALEKAVLNEEFKLFKEIFFYTPVTYKNFEEFRDKMMYVTYNKNDISKELEEKVKKKFNSITNNIETTFNRPFRVDILQKF